MNLIEHMPLNTSPLPPPKLLLPSVSWGYTRLCPAVGLYPTLHPLVSAPSSPWLGDVCRNGSIRI